MYICCNDSHNIAKDLVFYSFCVYLEWLQKLHFEKIHLRCYCCLLSRRYVISKLAASWTNLHTSQRKK